MRLIAVGALVLIAVILFFGLFEVTNPCPDGPLINPLTSQPMADQSSCATRLQPRLH